MFHVALVANPFAAHVDARSLAAVVAELERVARIGTLLTERRQHAVELVTGATDVDAVVVFGGDGVVNEAVNGLERDVPLAALPGGGTNVFARALGLPRDPVRAAAQVADALASGRSRRISLGVANGRRFTFACGIGLDAAAVRRVDVVRRRRGRRPGDVTFTLALLREVPRFRRPMVDIDGVGRAACAFVLNTDPGTYAGAVPLHIAPEARFELGLDIVAPVRLSAGAVPRFLRYVVRGEGQQRADDILYRHDVDEVKVACDRALPLQVDGEDLGDTDHVEVRCERGALSVLV